MKTLRGVLDVAYLSALGAVEATLLCTLFSWGMTALGAVVVFCFRQVKESVMTLFLGFGAGVMLAASVWSLLLPALEQSGNVLCPALGFAAGGGFILLAEYWCSYSEIFAEESSMRRSFLLILAVTLHNIPEGMAIGVAFGASSGLGPWLLALGIGLQNIPEGAAVSLPLMREGISRGKSFFFGQLSGAVEPVAALVGVLLALRLSIVLPFLLAFSAGAMVAVVGGELLPEAASANKNRTIIGFLLGFLLMMVLDVTLG